MWKKSFPHCSTGSVSLFFWCQCSWDVSGCCNSFTGCIKDPNLPEGFSKTWFGGVHLRLLFSANVALLKKKKKRWWPWWLKMVRLSSERLLHIWGSVQETQSGWRQSPTITNKPTILTWEASPGSLTIIYTRAHVSPKFSHETRGKHSWVIHTWAHVTLMTHMMPRQRITPLRLMLSNTSSLLMIA